MGVASRNNENELHEALSMLQSGNYSRARCLLERLAQDDPDNYIVLHNLGMCYSDLGMLAEAVRVLTRVTCLAPDFADGHVALGVAYARGGNNDSAINAINRALELEPDNPHALRNLGALRAKQGQYEEAVQLFQRTLGASPDDPRILYGLAAAQKALGNLSEADRYLQRLLGSNAPDEIRELAKDLRRKIAEIEFKKRGFRVDAVFHCLAALEYFADKSPSEVQQMTYEIALLGREGLDVNNPEKKYRVSGLPGLRSGLELVCYMYVGFKRLAPSMDVGFDLSREYEAALHLFQQKDV